MYGNAGTMQYNTHHMGYQQQQVPSYQQQVQPSYQQQHHHNQHQHQQVVGEYHVGSCAVETLFAPQLS